VLSVHAVLDSTWSGEVTLAENRRRILTRARFHSGLRRDPKPLAPFSGTLFKSGRGAGTQTAPTTTNPGSAQRYLFFSVIFRAPSMTCTAVNPTGTSGATPRRIRLGEWLRCRYE